jgi:hypothetical protein
LNPEEIMETVEAGRIEAKILTGGQLQELARKHAASVESVRHIAIQVRGLCVDVGDTSDGEMAKLISAGREYGKYHTAGMLWVIQMAKREGLSFYETVDLLAAIIDPGSFEEKPTTAPTG